MNSKRFSFILLFLCLALSHSQLQQPTAIATNDQLSTIYLSIQDTLQSAQETRLLQNGAIDFLENVQFVGEYSTVQSNKLFDYLDSKEGKIYLLFINSEDYDIISKQRVNAAVIALMDPKYQDQKAVVFGLKLNQIINNTWQIQNMNLSYSYYYAEQSYSSGRSDHLNITVTVSGTEMKDPKQVRVDIQFMGPEGSNVNLQAILSYNDDVMPTLYYSLFVSSVLLLQIFFSHFMIRQISQNQLILSQKFSLAAVTFCTIKDFNSMVQHIQFIVQISNSNLVFLIPCIVYICLVSAIDMLLILLVWKGHYLRMIDGPRALRRRLLIYYAQLYLALFVYLVFSYFFINYGWFILIQNMIFVPQIIRNVRRGTNVIFPKKFVFGYLGIRIIIPIYERICPENRLGLTPLPWLVISLIIVYSAQIVILYLQFRYKPRFFIPKSLQPDYYNYAKQLHRTEQNQDIECTICLFKIFESLEQTQTMITSELLLDKVQIMQTPCKHYFHDQCLKKWIEVKLQCPTCRKKLPPVI